MRGTLLFLLCAIMVGSIKGHARFFSGELGGGEHRYFDMEERADHMAVDEGVPTRRGLKAAAGGTSTKIGSRPPSCKAKCKGCVPCSPVEVTVPPAQHKSPFTRGPTTTTFYHLDESPYYSVAWRCRCKGKDYNP